MVDLNDVKKQEQKDVLIRNKPILLKLKSNLRAMELYKELYNHLCNNCKRKVLKNPLMETGEYCPVCREMVEYKMAKLAKLLGGELKC